jgi:hypothetical protein
MNIRNYIANSKKEVDGDHKLWIDNLLTRLPTHAKVFEVGSATPRDANYMKNILPDIDITCSDKEKEFVDYIRITGKKEALVFDILQDNFDTQKKYNALYAHLVINHFTLSEVKNMLEKMIDSTEQDAFISFSFPLGDNSSLSGWNNTPGNIYCRYHSIEEIQQITNDLHLKRIYLQESADSKMYYSTFQVS